MKIYDGEVERLSVKNLNEKGTFLLSYMHELRAELSS